MCPVSVGDIIAHAGRHGFRKTCVSNKTCDMTFLLYKAMLRCKIKKYTSSPASQGGMSCLLFCCRFGLRERIFIGRNKSEASLLSLLFSGSNSEAFCNYHGTTSLKASSSATPDRNRKKEVASIQGASVSFWNALHGAAQNLNEENKIAARRLHADTRSPD